MTNSIEVTIRNCLLQHSKEPGWWTTPLSSSLYAATGKVVWDVDTTMEHQTVNGVAAKGGALNGPGAVVAGGMLFVRSGYASRGFMPGHALLAYSVDGQ